MNSNATWIRSLPSRGRAGVGAHGATIARAPIPAFPRKGKEPNR